MADLNNTLIHGSLRVADKIYANNLNANQITTTNLLINNQTAATEDWVIGRHYAGSSSDGGKATSAIKSDTIGDFISGGGITWGVLKDSSIYTKILRLDTSNQGSLAFATSGNVVNMQIDGNIYIDEGKNKVASELWVQNKHYAGSSSDGGKATSAITADNFSASGTIKAEIDKKLNKAGDTMTGPIIFDRSSGIRLVAGDTESKIWQVEGNPNKSDYGFYELYHGEGSANENSIKLYSSNLASATPILIREIKQDGNIDIYTNVKTSQSITFNSDYEYSGNKNQLNFINSNNKNSYIGNNSIGHLGFYSSGNLYFRPHWDNNKGKNGIEINSSELIPSIPNTYDLGNATNLWKNVYATNFVGTADTAKNFDTTSGTIKTELDKKLNKTGGTMTGTLNFKDVSGIKINSNNKDVKIWEIVGNSGSDASQFGFHEFYNGAASGNDNSLKLYAHNRTGVHALVREIKQDGNISIKTPTEITNTLTINATTNGIINKGTAADNAIMTRGLNGLNDDTNTAGDLYLNLGNEFKTYFGKDRNNLGSLNSDGSISVSAISSNSSNNSSININSPIKFNTKSLPSKTLEFVCGIDRFDAGGQLGWQEKKLFLKDYATRDWVTNDSIPNNVGITRAASTDSARDVIFSHSDSNSKIVGNSKFQYNPHSDLLTVGNITLSNDLTLGGNLTVSGTTTTVDSTTLRVSDKIIEVGKDNTVPLTSMAGLVVPKYDGTNAGGLLFDSTGTAYVGDLTDYASDDNVTLAKNPSLQPLATRESESAMDTGSDPTTNHLVYWDAENNRLKTSNKEYQLKGNYQEAGNYVTIENDQTITGKKTFNGHIALSAPVVNDNNYYAVTNGTSGATVNYITKEKAKVGYASNYLSGGTIESGLNSKVNKSGDTMTGTLNFKDVSGIKINSNNKDIKVWEVVGNSGSDASQFGFHEFYNGAASGNDNSLKLYAHNQSGEHALVREIKQDGHVYLNTPLHFNSNSLPVKNLEYICGVDLFKNGGEFGCQSKDEFLSGYATTSWVNTDAVVKKLLNHVDTGGGWHKGRDFAPMKTTRGSSGYLTSISIGTSENGSWDISTYDDERYKEDLLFSYVSKSDYDNNTYNAVTTKLRHNKSGTIALTSDIPDISGKLDTSGGTLTGALTLVGGQFDDLNSCYGLNANNSNIVNLNGLYFADSSQATSEGLHFLQDTGKFDTFKAYNGSLYFFKNRDLTKNVSSDNHTSDNPLKYIIPLSTDKFNMVDPNTISLDSGLYCYTGTNGPTLRSGDSNGSLIHHRYSDEWSSQIVLDQGNGDIWSRANSGNHWTSWRSVAFKDELPDISRKLDTSGGTLTGHLSISYLASNVMTADSTNPKITFSDAGNQPVHLIYTDYDNYRSPAGLKVVGGHDASPAWFEAEGDIYSRGKKVLTEQSLDNYIDKTSAQTISGNKVFNGLLSAHNGLDLGNSNITYVNNITIADPGPDEGIIWGGGNDWRIFESPNDFGNSSGNMQITTGRTRQMTVETSGNVEIRGNMSIGAGSATMKYDSTNKCIKFVFA